MRPTRTPDRPDGHHAVAPALGRARRGAARLVATAVAVVVLLAVGSGAAWAWWSASANATAAATAAVVPAPTNVTCTVDSRLFFEDTVTIKWVAPTGGVPAGATRTYVLTFVSTSGTITKTVADGTLQLLVKWSDINANNGWNQKQTITVRSSLAFPSTTWASTAAGPVASTGSTTLGYNNLACATP
ncbi:MAG: hypothetical protein ABWY33_01130 [Cellulomonas sp.]